MAPVSQRVALTIEGERQGDWKLYWDNNNLMAIGRYENGERRGIWTDYRGDDGAYLQPYITRNNITITCHIIRKASIQAVHS